MSWRDLVVMKKRKYTDKVKNTKQTQQSQIEHKECFHPITLDAFRAAGQDLFALIVDVDQVVRFHGISTIEFISKVFSTESRTEQIGYIIEILEVLQAQEARKAQESQNEQAIMNGRDV